MVTLPIELACTGQIKPGLVVLGDRLVQQRALGVARVVEFWLGCCLHECCANTQYFATSGWALLGMATIIASGIAAAALRRRAVPDAPHDEQQLTSGNELMDVVLRKYGNSTVVVLPPGVLRDLSFRFPDSSRSTFDMSGGPKGAKRPLERPLDGVRAHSPALHVHATSTPCLTARTRRTPRTADLAGPCSE